MINENFVKYFEEKFKEYWSMPAMADYGKRSINYKELSQSILFFHKVFSHYKIGLGDKIALSGKNCVNWSKIYLSGVLYGASVVPILNNFSCGEMQHIIHHSEAKILFVSDKLIEDLDLDRLTHVEAVFSLYDFKLIYDKRKVFTGEYFEKEFDSFHSRSISKEDFSLSSKIANDNIAAMIYTSGTTGFSKGVMLSYNSLMGNVIVARENLLFKQGANVVAFLPLAHAYACSFDLIYPLTCGNFIHFMDKLPSPKVLLQAFAELKPNVVLAVPLIIEKIYKKTIAPELLKTPIKVMLSMPLLKNVVYNKIRSKLIQAFGGNLTELVVGGAAMNHEVESFLKEIKFPVTIGYGMTECGPLIAYANWHKHRLGSSGQVVKYLEVKIDSPDPENVNGEILIKGEQVTDGYYKNPEVTKETLDKDGWLHSGDIGVLDKDNFIYIRGRSKNVIIGSSGENVYPEDIEQKINNLPFILESLVMEKEGKIVAMVYPDFDELDKHHIHETKINDLMIKNKNTINDQLPAHSKVTRIIIVSEPFQKTPTQKIKRYLYNSQ